jgi:hypothetical protein
MRFSRILLVATVAAFASPDARSVWAVDDRVKFLHALEDRYPDVAEEYL